MGVVVRRYIDILTIIFPTPLVLVLFLQQHSYFFDHCLMFFRPYIILYCINILLCQIAVVHILQ